MPIAKKTHPGCKARQSPSPRSWHLQLHGRGAPGQGPLFPRLYPLHFSQRHAVKRQPAAQPMLLHARLLRLLRHLPEQDTHTSVISSDCMKVPAQGNNTMCMTGELFSHTACTSKTAER